MRNNGHERIPARDDLSINVAFMTLTPQDVVSKFLGDKTEGYVGAFLYAKAHAYCRLITRYQISNRAGPN